jgi:PAS domain S-box-containing protein
MPKDEDIIGPVPFGGETLDSLKLRLSTFIEDFPVPLALFDRAMNYVAVSKSWVKTFRLQGETLIGKCQYDIAPWMSQELRAAHRAGLVGRTISNEESRTTLPDGTETWQRWTIRPIHGADDEVTGIVVVTEDITEAVQARHRMEDSEHRLSHAMDVARIGLFEVRADTGEIYVSPTIYDLLDAEGPFDTIEEFIQLAAPEDQVELRRLRDNVLDPTGTGLFSLELAPEIGGMRRHFELKGRVEYTGEGEARRPVRGIGVLFDRTERARLSNALASAQRLETVGRMAGMIAHDFNNLLTVIMSNLEFASDQTVDRAMKDYLRRATEATQLGASFTRRLLSLSGAREPRPSALAVDEHLTRTWTMLERVLGEDAHTTFVPGAPEGAIFLDRGELDGAVLNLVLNAREATADRGTISISTGTRRLTAADAGQIPGGRPGDFVWLTVTDTGAGMSPDVAQKAIEPFFTTKMPDRGSGLGLTSVATMLSRAGGFLRIDSEVGAGTDVTLYFPRVDMPELESGTLSKDMPRGDGELVLVVEDDPLVRESVLDRLEALGYAVIEAGSADQAISLVERGEPVDLVFSDVVLPGRKTGIDLVEHLCAEGRKIPALLTSGHTSLREDARMTGDIAMELLPKPYTLHTLAVAVARALKAEACRSRSPV